MSEIPVYSVVAFSGTGKTTLLEKLIPLLKARGLRVGVLKHNAHAFELDREGKDSWRLTKAGADVTAIANDHAAAIMENRYVPAETMISRIRDVDVILSEGLKHGPWPKIALLRFASGSPLPPAPPEGYFAVLSDRPLEISAPFFDLDDEAGLADLILRDMEHRAGGTAS